MSEAPLQDIANPQMSLTTKEGWRAFVDDGSERITRRRLDTIHVDHASERAFRGEARRGRTA
ncbi:hypothetical protein J7E96_09915 [Streptomyces sp. ISL-96]|uniref:hypothetical protein n=1 Tax=Streptomyces sp. ISL-96 TaxID=2819191 RepID=UPI001BEB127E|nr:hypothetical protein [Streptomyces sp. ISL-96]MBT2488832.1 hypothetical protein [Streptomyces sp. ISL-96]